MEREWQGRGGERERERQRERERDRERERERERNIDRLPSGMLPDQGSKMCPDGIKPVNL